MRRLCAVLLALLALALITPALATDAEVGVQFAPECASLYAVVAEPIRLGSSGPLGYWLIPELSGYAGGCGAGGYARVTALYDMALATPGAELTYDFRGGFTARLFVRLTF